MIYSDAINSQEPITPLQIFGSSCKLWLNTRRSSITESAGAVSQIDDLSGNGIDFIQSTGASKPTLTSLSGRFTQVLEFDGVDDYLEDASGSLSYFNFLHESVGTVFIVAYIIPTNLNIFVSLISDFNGSPNIGINMGIDDRSSVSRNNSVVVVTSNGTAVVVNNYSGNDVFSPQNWNCLITTIDNANATVSNRSDIYVNNIYTSYANNSNTGTPTSSNYTRSMKIACRGDALFNFSNLYLAEIVIANVEASEYQRVLLKRWAQSEWGITV